ncbi:DUF2567 domain-containing protein [Micromonospora auratinigra]|uniref:DUF2567 domain-containing protein n=1 Tax=Micromonospora auratinigra TaxID=261654 RepID=A0A1A8ZLF3_9ACTN|nr:Protein of unknown function (DUF2567) [Micromonospora auratinigra]
MSPDTPDPERAPDRPGPADATGSPAATPPGPPAATTPPGGRPDGGSRGGPDLPDWPAGLPVPAGTPVTAPGADPLAGHPGVAGALPGTDPFTGQPGGAGAVPGIDPFTGHPVAAGAVPVTDRPAGGLRAVGVTLGAALLIAVLGAPLGLLWAAVAPDTPVRKVPDGAVYAVPQPEQPIAADGWFSLLGIAFGVLAAIGLWALLRRRRGPAGLAAGVLGGLGAAVLAWQVGRRIGLGTYDRLLASAPDGTAFTKPADLRSGGVDWFLHLPLPYGSLLLPAFGAAVTYTLLAGWSRWPSLRPEPDPYGGWPTAPVGGPGWPGGVGAPHGGGPGHPGEDPGGPAGPHDGGPGDGRGGPGSGISSGPGDRPAR